MLNKTIKINQTTKKIGLYGGSFDPIHQAHIQLAVAAKSHLNLDELHIIPAANPWQRQPLKASPQHRLKMLEIALQKHSDWLKINNTEIHRGGATYTIDTLKALPPNDYYWIMGSDQLENFCSWHKWQEIAQLVTLTVAKRPEHSIKPPTQLLDYLSGLNKSIIEIPFTQFEISATKIRQILHNRSNVSEHAKPSLSKSTELLKPKFEKSELKQPKSQASIKLQNQIESELRLQLQDLMPVSVLNYIIEHNLYT